MKLNKTLIAAAMMAATGAANAATFTNGVGGANEMFLSVYDSVQGKTFNLDMGVSFDQLKTGGATAALAAFEGAGKSLSADANWSAFAAGITNIANVRYLVAADNNNNTTHTGAEIFVSGGTPLAPLASLATLAPAALAIDAHSLQLATGAGANPSSLILDTGATLTGKFNDGGVFANALWSGWPIDPTQAFGTAVNFYQGGVSQIAKTNRNGSISMVDAFQASDVTNLGTFTLAGSTLTFAPAGVSAVPLPAAVWMFGAGLMGLLRVTRRKSVEI